MYAATAAAKSLQLCPTQCDPIDGSPPGFSVPGILQARILQWVAISFSRRSSRPRDWNRISYIVGRCFTIWTTRQDTKEHIKKQRHHFSNKGAYGCESQTIKRAECPRTDAFKLCCWKRLLRVLWTAGRSNQSILKDINPEYSLERLILNLKLQYFDQMMPRADSLEKTLMLGRLKAKEEGGGRG